MAAPCLHVYREQSQPHLRHRDTQVKKRALQLPGTDGQCRIDTHITLPHSWLSGIPGDSLNLQTLVNLPWQALCRGQLS